MNDFWIFFGPIIIGTIIGILIFRTTNNYNKFIVEDFKSKLNNINEYKTYSDIVNVIGNANEINYENEYIIKSWIIRSENRILYKVSIKFDRNDNNLGKCFETNQI